MMTVGSLFSGIGGFDLGLERAGMRVIWQSEIDPYASAVLRKHWPNVPNLGDIRAIASAPRVDVICGGFPCQDISNAGKRAGIDGERSGLWSEYARVIGELRPRYVIVENVSALLGRGIERVLGDLAALGYDAEWHCIPASAVGAPHRRDRVWIVAHARSISDESLGGSGQLDRPASSRQGDEEERERIRDAADGSREDVAHARRRGRAWGDWTEWRGWSSAIAEEVSRQRNGSPGNDVWAIEPDVGRVANGIPKRVDRLRCLGNAIVPQIAEMIGRAIVGLE